MKISKGSFRAVYKVFGICFKFSRIKYGYKNWIYGILMNLQEYNFYRKHLSASGTYSSKKYCPVYFTFLGIFNIVPFCKSITAMEFCKIDKNNYPFCEHKRDSYGKYKGRIVALDYTDFGIQGQTPVIQKM